MTSGPDRSLTGISFPKWMKSKIVDRNFEFEENAFSPPTGDDGFFLMRLKKAVIPEETQQSSVSISSSVTSRTQSLRSFDSTNADDVSKHTPACQQYISKSHFPSREVGFHKGSSEGLNRTADDSAACGYSVVAVAHQMLAERNLKPENVVVPASQRVRRNSKSLPASPLSSPKLLRKNPYFTSVLFGSTDKVSAENSSLSLSKTLSVEGSTEDILGRDLDNSSLRPPSRILRAKPSELREMNFWSPTSM